MYRLTSWPIIFLKHDGVAQYFLDRKTVGDSKPQTAYSFSEGSKTIGNVIVATECRSCFVPVLVAMPGGAASAPGDSPSANSLCSDPPIEWAILSGSPVTV